MRTDPVPEIYRSDLRGLDFNRYRIIGWIPGYFPVIFQESIGDEPKHYCVQYGGSGHYYSTLAEVQAYYEKRFGRALKLA